jgi:hypothetical protein
MSSAAGCAALSLLMVAIFASVVDVYQYKSPAVAMIEAAIIVILTR